jgi:hypothetical protein
MFCIDFCPYFSDVRADAEDSDTASEASVQVVESSSAEGSSADEEDPDFRRAREEFATAIQTSLDEDTFDLTWRPGRGNEPPRKCELCHRERLYVSLDQDESSAEGRIWMVNCYGGMAAYGADWLLIVLSCCRVPRPGNLHQLYPVEDMLEPDDKDYHKLDLSGQWCSAYPLLDKGGVHRRWIHRLCGLLSGQVYNQLHRWFNLEKEVRTSSIGSRRSQRSTQF